MAWIVSFFLKALVILGISKVVPGMRVQGFGTALAVALVYAFLSVALKWLLVLLSLPMIIVTFGLFFFVVNARLVWVTDQLLGGVDVGRCGHGNARRMRACGEREAGCEAERPERCEQIVHWKFVPQ